MRKLAILTILAVPVSALGAYALAASDDPVSSDSRIIVNEAEKGDLATSDQSTRLLALDDSDEDETEARPLRPNELTFNDDDEDHDDDGDRDDDD